MKMLTKRACIVIILISLRLFQYFFYSLGRRQQTDVRITCTLTNQWLLIDRHRYRDADIQRFGLALKAKMLCLHVPLALVELMPYCIEYSPYRVVWHLVSPILLEKTSSAQFFVKLRRPEYYPGNFLFQTISQLAID
jgi:hypothetical protein